MPDVSKRRLSHDGSHSNGVATRSGAPVERKSSFLMRVLLALAMLTSCSVLVHLHMAASVSSPAALPPRHRISTDGALTARQLKAELAVRQLRAQNESGGASRFDVTLVSQSSEERLWMVRPLSRRWGGPVSIAIFLEDPQIRALSEAAVAQAEQQPGVTITTVDGANSSVYPINALRNMAVARVTTSHFLLTDIDLWPSNEAYRRVLALGPTYLRRPRTAVLLPAFEYTLGGLLKRGVSSDDHNFLVAHVPATFDALRTCVASLVPALLGRHSSEEGAAPPRHARRCGACAPSPLPPSAASPLDARRRPGRRP
jgi:hypothetical protein